LRRLALSSGLGVPCHSVSLLIPEARIFCGYLIDYVAMSGLLRIAANSPPPPVAIVIITAVDRRIKRQTNPDLTFLVQSLSCDTNDGQVWERFMASEFEKPDASRFMPNCFVVDPLSNLLPLFSCSAFWRSFPVQPPGVRFFSAFWRPLPVEPPGSHISFNPLPAYSIENLFWN
jgi:hypothetical protein